MADKKKKPNKWIQKAELKEGAFTAKAKTQRNYFFSAPRKCSC
jgi:hypothetical protein